MEELSTTLNTSMENNPLKERVSEHLLHGRVALPKQIFIDPIGSCNLKCPLCPTGMGIASDFKGMLTLEEFNGILDQIPDLEHLLLYNVGESFLNPQIFEMIQEAKSRDIFVEIHSNFSFRRPKEFFENILDSKLDLLRIALDGTTQAPYETIRRGGNAQWVMDNVSQLAKLKKENQSLSPEIRLRTIHSKKNPEELQKVKAFAEEIGVIFEPVRLFLGLEWLDFPIEDMESHREEWMPSDENFVREHYRESKNQYCGALFSTLVVNSHRKVTPCCWANSSDAPFGDLKKNTLSEIWNGESYRTARELALSGKADANKCSVVCERCRIYPSTPR